MSPELIALLGVLTDAEVGRRAGLTGARVQQIRAARGIAAAPRKPRAARGIAFAPGKPPPLPQGAIATMLRDARIAAALFQAGLAAKMGVSPTHVSLVESGHRQPSLDVLHAWADACGRDLVVTMVPR